MIRPTIANCVISGRETWRTHVIDDTCIASVDDDVHTSALCARPARRLHRAQLRCRRSDARASLIFAVFWRLVAEMPKLPPRKVRERVVANFPL